jgi:small-conductance mechanosensitive channel
VKELWISISSVTLAFVFVFGNSIRNIYEGVIFLFVVHAFDVGDYLLINDSYHKVGCGLCWRCYAMLGPLGCADVGQQQCE